jgi:excisionase family DNA binding protein
VLVGMPSVEANGGRRRGTSRTVHGPRNVASIERAIIVGMQQYQATHEAHWRYAEAARFLGLSLATLRGLVARRRIPHARLGPRLVLFDPHALRRWIKARTVRPATEEP